MSGFLPEELPAYLAERGFAVLEDTSTAAAARRLCHASARTELGSELYHVAIAERR